MTALGAGLAILACLAAFHALGVLPAARRALSHTAEAGRVIRDPDLSDDEKEAAVRRAALGLLVSVVSIAARSAGCLLTAVAPVYLLAALGLAGDGATFALLTRWDVILVSSLLIGAGMVWTAKRKVRAPKSDYSAMDRAVHRLAFAARGSAQPRRLRIVDQADSAGVVGEW